MLALGCGGSPVSQEQDAAIQSDSRTSDATIVAPALASRFPIRSILWVGAHPDDEGYASPLFYDLCKQRGTACTFLVVTDGGKGNCVLGAGACGVTDNGGAPAGSGGAFRIKEMQNSAAFFGANLLTLKLEDTGSDTVGGVAENWNIAIGGASNSIDAIVANIAAAIRQSQADIIVTFDPRHGVYCQPDHRAAGALTLMAATAVNFDPNRLLMVETTEFFADLNGMVNARAWVPQDTALLAYDSNTAGTWSAHAAVLNIHKSQYTSDAVAILDQVATTAKLVPLLPVANAMSNLQTSYAKICASQDARWDGHGVCPKADGTTGPCF
jgi:LmbE family N-acetylglucosaminyl deacetylase